MNTIPSENLTSGRVSWDGDPERVPTFAARWDPAQRWNGWLCPFFDRENVQRLIDFNNGLGDPQVDTFEWDGDVLIQHFEGDPKQIDRIEPTLIDGVLYWDPGAHSWTWCEVEGGSEPEVSVTIEVRAALAAGEAFTAGDLLEAVRATLHEVFPVDGGLPVVPTVTEVTR